MLTINHSDLIPTFGTNAREVAELVHRLGAVSVFDGTQYTRVQKDDVGFVITAGCLDERDWFVIL